MKVTESSLSENIKEQERVLASIYVDPLIVRRAEAYIIGGSIVGLLVGGAAGHLLGPGRSSRYWHAFYFVGMGLTGSIMGATLGLQRGLGYMKEQSPEFSAQFAKWVKLKKQKRIEEALLRTRPVQDDDHPLSELDQLRKELTLNQNDPINDFDFLSGLLSFILAAIIIFMILDVYNKRQPKDPLENLARKVGPSSPSVPPKE